MAGASNRRFQGQDVMKSFLAACGLEESLQLVVESQTGHEDELRLLNQPFAIIGRDLRADVVLDHPQVSRRHVYLQVVEGRPFWLDLESRTGTRGDRESQKFGWLVAGKTLAVGPYTIRRFIGGGPTKAVKHDELPRDPPLVALNYNGASLPDVALQFLNGPSQSMSRPVHRVMSLIGSTSGCKFRLTDPSVSRFHACILRTSAGVWIVDLLGQSGVFVNEESVRFGRLTDGDLLRIGRYQIRVRCRVRNQGLGARKSGYSQPAVFSKVPRHRHASNALEGPDWNATPMPPLPRPEGANAEQLPAPIHAHTSFPKFELMPSDATFSNKLGQADSTESVLVPLVNQFGMMQQQMFDQFQQAIAMMVQMFGEMHRDQMKVIREELDRLHDLTDELNALRSELANHSGERPEVASGSDVANMTENNSPAVPAATAFKLPPLPGTQAPSPVQSNPPPATSSPGTLGGASPAPQQVKRSGTIPPGDTDRDTVIWLHQRIMALQNERTSRWQRILKLLPGMSS
jgi:pSer/pThr/pTyr-binding forkhead associated (FHA) protein